MYWLSHKQHFSGDVWSLYCYQLAQCRGFVGWVPLRDFREGFRDDNQFGVQCLLLATASESGPGVVKTLRAAFLAPQRHPWIPESEQRVYPLNFQISHGADPAWDALEEARRAVRDLFTVRGCIFWLAYLFCGDVIFLTVLRLLRLLRHVRGLHRTLSDDFIYIRAEPTAGSQIGGRSLGVPCALAILLGLSSLQKSRFLRLFFVHCFRGIAGRAFTGCLKNGKIYAVEGLQGKLESLRRYPEIREAIIPSANIRDPDRSGLLNIDQFRAPVPVKPASRFLFLLAALVPLRKTWAIMNCACIVGLVLAWSYIHSFRHPAPRFMRVSTSVESISAENAVTQGLRLLMADRLVFEMSNSPSDGQTRAVVHCNRLSDGTESQALRSAADRGDWRSELDLPVVEGKFAIDYRRHMTNSLSCLGISVRLFRRQRLISHDHILLLVAGER